MNSEDRVAAKLKGLNCLIKFNDGEELLLKIADLNNDDLSVEWLMDMEKFINGSDDVDYCPIPGCAILRGSIKYVMQI